MRYEVSAKVGLAVSISAVLVAAGRPCPAQEMKETVAPRAARGAPLPPIDREDHRERRNPQEAEGPLPEVPGAPTGARVMLPERQRLLETRLEATSRKPFAGFGVQSVWENGPRGWLDLSVGLSLGGRDGFRNVAVNGGLELTPWLRGHVTAVARSHNTRLSSERLLQEAYLEAYESWRLGGGEFATSIKAGTTQNLSYPFPDTLSLFELAGRGDGREQRDFRGYKHLVGVADFAHRTGLGFHAAASKRVTDRSHIADTRLHMIDYYLRYRGDLSGLAMEARLGALNPSRPLDADELPHQPRMGQSLYVGKEWELASAGLLLEKVGGDPLRYGVRINLPLGSVGEALGNFLGRYHRQDRSVKAQLPLGTLLFGQRLEPPSGTERVGTIRATRVYRAGSFLGGDTYPLNYEYIVDTEGVTEGTGLVRVARLGPRTLWDTGALGGPGIDGSTRITNSFRQDVTYEIYRVGGGGPATLAVRIVDAEQPDRELSGARIVRLGGGGEPALAAGGRFRLQETIGREPLEVRLMVSAPGYLDEIASVTLERGENRDLEVRLKRATGGLTVELVDAETGAPIVEAEVHVGAAGAKPSVSLTDAKGTARAGPLPPGRYQISTYAPRYYDQKAETAVEAGKGERLVLRLKPRPGSIAGRLLSADGKPIPGATVTLTDAEGKGFGVMSTLEDGTFGTTGLKPGRYTVAVQTPGGSARGEADVKAGEIEAVEIRLK
jgi:hypothetical protein